MVIGYVEAFELPQSRITQDIKWSYKGWVISWELRIPTYAYLSYARITPEERLRIGIANMVTHDDLIIATIASGLKKEAKQKGFGEYDTANYILAFVQSLSYHDDKELTPYNDYWKFPIETLAEGWGDCEDTSILYAALMKAAGYDIVLLQMPDHMAVGVALSKPIFGAYIIYNGKRYFYAETTASGWLIGKVPPENAGKPVIVVTIPDKPSGTKLSIEKLNEELNYTPERFKQLESENNKLKEENKALKSLNSKLEAENQKLLADNSKLKKQISDLKVINENLQKQIQKLTNKNSELQSQITKLENELDSLNSKISTLEQTITKLSETNGIMFITINALIALTIGVAAAAYYRGKRAKEKEIFGL